ncbi:MAG: MFS transporter [Pseudomonadota bacterium]|nr:MFS transporter [Pseudomonadota bacterium]
MAGVIATVSVFAIAQGLSYPLLSIILERQGNPAILVGLSAAMTPCGLMASAPLIPLLSRRFGAGPTALICALFAALLFALIGWTENLAAWFPLRFLVGVVIGPLYVLSEVWLIGLAPPERRGRVVGIYTTAISAGLAAGPFSLMLVGTHGWPPYLVGIAAFLACTVCLAATLPRLPPTEREGAAASLRSFLPHAPVLLLAVMVMAAFEQTALSLFPVYGMAYGIGEFGISALLAVLIAGNIALQIPIGIVSERYRPRSVMIACAALSGLGCLVLPVLIGTVWQWPFVFLWGALSYGIYTTAFLELGDRFTGSMLVAGNAAFALMWGFGGIAGPPATGALMDTFGVQGFPAVLAFLCLGLAAVALLAQRRGPTERLAPW